MAAPKLTEKEIEKIKEDLAYTIEALGRAADICDDIKLLAMETKGNG